MCLFLEKMSLKVQVDFNIFASFRLGVYIALEIRMLMSSFVLCVLFVFAWRLVEEKKFFTASFLYNVSSMEEGKFVLHKGVYCKRFGHTDDLRLTIKLNLESEDKVNVQNYPERC